MRRWSWILPLLVLPVAPMEFEPLPEQALGRAAVLIGPRLALRPVRAVHPARSHGTSSASVATRQGCPRQCDETETLPPTARIGSPTARSIRGAGLRPAMNP